MKKNLLVSALLLANPIAQMSAKEINEVRTQALNKAAHKAIQVYNSLKPVTINGKEYTLRLKFLKPDVSGITFLDSTTEVPSESVQVNYELIVELVNVKTGKVSVEASPTLLQWNGEDKFLPLSSETTVEASFKAIPCSTDDYCAVGAEETKSEVIISDNFLTITNAESVFFMTDRLTSLKGDIEFFRDSSAENSDNK